MNVVSHGGYWPVPAADRSGGHVGVDLNFGCGKDIREGWVNADRVAVDGAVRVDIDREDLPWEDGTYRRILLSHVLEHIVFLEHAWEEFHRVLSMRGVLVVAVPYGRNADPFHIRFFNRDSVDRLLEHGSCAWENGRWYELVDGPRTGRMPPNPRGRRFKEMRFVLRKIA